MDRTHPGVSVGWLVALGAAGGLLGLAALPGWLDPAIGHGVREAFSLVCHQIPERSPHLGGGTWALCHRCTGILAGVVLGLLSGPFVPSFVDRMAEAVGAGRLLLLMGLPTFLDWLLGATGVWANTPASRLLTGALFGLAAGWLLADALRRPAPSPLTPIPTS